MTFNSWSFILLFAVILSIYGLVTSWTGRKLVLLVASYAFYAAWNPPFVLLLALSTGIDWVAASRLSSEPRPRYRRAWLLLSLSTNLGLLGFFKYGEFLVHEFAALVGALGLLYRPPEMSIVLPVGISFYTFQTLSYTIDVYRGRMTPSASLLDFSLYVSFFPQLVAGPIVRGCELLPQFGESRRAQPHELSWGLTLLLIGLFQKTVLADHLMAPVADLVYANVDRAGCFGAWLGTLAFSSQIFFDFSGYSTCAIGIAMCFGFSLPDNFRSPYAAVGFSDFWNRWHISLSSWLRDYLYIPLGGNRHGSAVTRRNLMLTMLLGGLWHGAAWRFVVWGGLHGIFLVVERAVRRYMGWVDARPSGWPGFAGCVMTYTLVCVGWVFFRAPDLTGALALLRTMLLGPVDDRLALDALSVGGVLVGTSGLVIGHWLARDTSLEQVAERTAWWLRSLLLAGMMCALALCPGGDRAFIYFQF